MVEGKLLLAVAAAMQGNTESILTMMKFAVLPIAKVFVMCFLGFILATKYVNILTPRSRKLLNGLVFTLFLPCLIFTQLGRAVTVRKMIHWWFIPANVVMATITGSIIGFFVAIVARPPPNYFKFTIVQIGIGNIGNVPLVLISALCQDKGNPFGNSSSCSQLGTAYISFGQWVGAVILYTYVFYMLTPPKESDTLQRPSHEVRLLVDESENLKIPFIQETDGNADLESTDWRARSRKIYNNLASLAERLKLKQIMQPPIIASSIRPMAAVYLVTKLGIASAIIKLFANNAGCPTIIEIKSVLLAMVMGAIPSIKKLILEDDAPLFFITDSCVILGGAMIPCILLALGGSLVGGPGPGSSTLGLRTTVAIIFGRLVLVPPAGLGIVMLADKLGFLPPNDKMFRFVLLLQHSMPTTILGGAVANLRGFGEKEAAAVLFWVHIFAVFSMAGWIILYLHILF